MTAQTKAVNKTATRLEISRYFRLVEIAGRCDVSMRMCANGVYFCVTRFVRRSDGVGSEFASREQPLRHFFRSFQKQHCACFACAAAAAVHALRHVRFRVSIHAGIAIPAAVVDIPISVFYCIVHTPQSYYIIYYYTSNAVCSLTIWLSFSLCTASGRLVPAAC